MSRRAFVFKAALLSTAFAAKNVFSQSSPERVNPSDKSVISAWMQDVMETKTLNGRLYFSRFVEPIFFLVKPIHWEPSEKQKAFKVSAVNVPAGFVTDLASVPRIFWSIFRPDGEYAHAAIIHDYLYWDQRGRKADADLIFKLAMEDLEVKPATVSKLYEAVNRFGDDAWATNTKLKANGEKRLLKRYPEAPNARWRCAAVGAEGCARVALLA